MSGVKRKIKRAKKRKAEKELKEKMFMFDKLGDSCMTCDKPLIKKIKSRLKAGTQQFEEKKRKLTCIVLNVGQKHKISLKNSQGDKMIIEYATTKFGVKPPTRSNPSDAGLDVYAFLDKTIQIEAGQNKMISTGLKFGIPHGYMLQVCNRSSMGAKRSLVVGAHIIDSGYDGEVFIDLHNIGNQTQSIN